MRAPSNKRFKKTLRFFLKENKLSTALKPEYTIESYEDTKGLCYKLELELFPEVPEASEEGLTIQWVSPLITDQEVD